MALLPITYQALCGHERTNELRLARRQTGQSQSPLTGVAISELAAVSLLRRLA